MALPWKSDCQGEHYMVIMRPIFDRIVNIQAVTELSILSFFFIILLSHPITLHHIYFSPTTIWPDYTTANK